VGLSFSWNFRSAFRALALSLGFAALMVQAIAPLCLGGLIGSGSPGASSIVLCTAHGFQTVALDSDGNPLPPAPAKSAPDSLCPMCVAFHSGAAFIAPALIFAVLALIFSRERPFIALARLGTSHSYRSYSTRAPPGLRFGRFA
jgi:DUF2946 family protein